MKILVVTLSNLGDVILTLPVLQALRKRYPEAALDVVTGTSGAIVFEGDGRLRRVNVYDKKMSWAHKWRFLQAVRRERYDILIDLRHSLTGLLGGARKRNSYLNFFSRRGHRGAKHLQALKGLAPTDPTHGSWLGGLPLRGPAPLLPEGRLVVAAVGSKSDLKKWPAQKYAELLGRLAQEQGCPIVFIGDKNDAADAEAVKKNLSAPSHDLTGKTDFRGLVAVIHRASLLVTNDSAPLHIADSLGVPTLALFGPSNPLQYGPRRAGSLAVSKKLSCQPCERAQCRYGHRNCLERLEAADVYPKAVRALKGKTRSENFRILVVRLDRIGDLVLSLPAIEALRRRFPDAGISVMTRPATQELFLGHPAIDEVIAYDYGRGGRHAFGPGYFRLLEEVMKRRFDAAVILHPGIRSYLIPFLAGIPERVGYRNKHAWLLTRPAADERRHGRKHESQYALDLVALLTGVREGAPALPVLEAGPVRFKTATIALHPGASCPSKRWPAERFRALAKALLSEFPGHRVALVGGPETREAVRDIVAGLGERVSDLSGKQSLRELAGFLSSCELLVSNDSGPVHVAAAVGTRVVSLFGRNQDGLSPQRWRPLGHGHAVLQKDVGCLVCLAHKCPIEFECLKAIRVEDVMGAVRKILAEAVSV